jgi:hypothetical protein
MPTTSYSAAANPLASAPVAPALRAAGMADE